jgi:hypothetical protein
MHKVHRRARSLVHFVLQDFSWDEVFSHARNSAGSSIGVSYNDTSEEAKFTYPISITRGAKSIFDDYLSFDASLRKALDVLNAGNPSPRYDIVDSSRATTVRKDSKKERFICIEPTGNMFLQQGLMRMMYARLEAVGLDVQSLPNLHGVRAMEGSRDGNLATLDASHASDSVGLELVRWLTPPDWFRALASSRCEAMDVGGEVIPLHVYATMGNATTFPMETLIFWAYAIATRHTIEGGNSVPADTARFKNITVFGDDVIVPTDLAPIYIRVLESIGFDMNVEKSHFYREDRFRESCGHDFIAGYPCRPFFLKRPPDERHSTVESWLYHVFNEVRTSASNDIGNATMYLLPSVRHSRRSMCVRTLFPLTSRLMLD